MVGLTANLDSSVVAASRVILLVEDEAAIAEPLQYALRREGWQVIWHSTAHAALQALAQQAFDFIILDVGLPDLDGFELCRKIRQHWQTPLLFLTARNEEIERIIGIELGADDYCAKPFSPREIISRIKAIWRRMQQVVDAQHSSALMSSTRISPTTSNAVFPNPTLPNTALSNSALLTNPTITHSALAVQELLVFDAWQADLKRCQICYHQQFLSLTRYEFGLLLFLLRHPEQVFSRAQLMQQVWENPDHSLERTVDSHIKLLRQKLKLIHPDDPIITHRGLGYSLKRSTADH